MVDSITGFGGNSDEITLGLNLSTNFSGATNDLNTVDQILQQINKDQETFNSIQNDSFEKAKSLTQELRNSGQEAQQLINIFKTLRGEQQGNLGDAKQLAAVYQQINTELQKASQTQKRLGITSPLGSETSSPGTPSTQTGGGSGGGIKPPPTGGGPGFAQEPDDFFGREEIKSGVRRSNNKTSSDLESFGGIDALDLENVNAFGQGTSAGGAATTGSAIDEQYKKLSDLAWAIFPNRGYYRNMRRVRWLTRNEGGSINKFVTSNVGKKVGLALNRLGGGQHLRTQQGYQLFPFSKNENGDYVDNNNKVVGGQYGLQDPSGEWIKQGGEGLEQPTWAWNGEGMMPPIPEGVTPQAFDPWARPNLTATGEGVAKIAGSAYALRMAKSAGGNLFREGQLYTGITGGTGIAGSLKYDLGAQLTSWFGMNPLESYGQAKQITMQNLALGYRGNLLNRANQFSNTALQQYGVDPTTSMQMFGQMVMQAGVSLQDLHASLATLAQTASTTNTSFSQLQQNVIQYSQIGSSIGLTGGQNAAFATSAAQFAAGQPGLAATGANPSDILNSMVGQALVAQQMGTSFLGLPGASQQQGATGVLAGVIHANQSLMSRIGLTGTNYKNPQALNNAYQKFQLLTASIPGLQHLSHLSYNQYVNYIDDLYNGKQTKMLNKTLSSNFAQDMGVTPGKNLGSSLGAALTSSNRYEGQTGTNNIDQQLSGIQSQHKWKNIGVNINGKFTSLSEIEKLPAGERSMIEARIGTGSLPVSHMNQHGKWVKGSYTSSTLLDLQGHSAEQFNTFGRTPNQAKMAAVEKNAIRTTKIELGPNAKKLFTLLDDVSSFNRYYNNWAKTHGSATTSEGNPRTHN